MSRNISQPSTARAWQRRAVKPLAALASVAAALTAASPAVAKPLTPAAPTAKKAYVAKIVVKTAARAQPGSGPVVARLATTAALYGGANELLITETARKGRRLFVRVLLPSRPNDATGWVNADQVVIRKTNARIVVDISERTVTLMQAGRQVARSSAVVGASSTPTPEGLFAVSEIITQPRNSELGRQVIALTSHSDVHRTFAGGDGRVALHSYERLGDRLGSTASNGCVRLPARFVKRLARAAGPGTPVLVTP